LQELRVAFGGLVEQIHRLKEAFRGGWIRVVTFHLASLLIQLECEHVFGGRLRDPSVFLGGNPGAELVGDSLRDLALNSEDVSQVAVVGLRPEMRVGPPVDQLRAHPHFASYALDTPFEQIRDAKLPADLSQVARHAALVLRD
jgi:hypothetical protein